MRGSVAVGMLLGALAGCGAPRTEMVVDIASSDLAIPGDVDALTLRVRDFSTGDLVYLLPPTALCGSTRGCLALPTAVTLYPGPDRPHDLVEVEVQALKGSAVVIDDAATFSFADGQSQELEFVLYRSCLQTACAASSTQRTCIRDGRCGDIAPVPLGADLAMGDVDLGAPVDQAMGDLPPVDLAGADQTISDGAAAPDLTPIDLSAQDHPSADGTVQVPTPDTSNRAQTPNGTVLSWQHSVSNGATLLVVGVCTQGTHSISSVTYDGAMMSEVNSVATGSSEVGLYYLAAPAAGTFPVQVTLDGSQSMAVGSISFLGTAEAKPLANSGMGNGMSAMSAILTGLGDLVVDVVCTDGTTAPNPAVGQTQRVMKSSGATTADSAIGMSTRPAANGTTTMTWTLNPGAPWALVVAGLAP